MWDPAGVMLWHLLRRRARLGPQSQLHRREAGRPQFSARVCEQAEAALAAFPDGRQEHR